MSNIAKYKAKVYFTKDRKSLKHGPREYEYGTINIRDSKLKNHIGETVMVIVETPAKGKDKNKEYSQDEKK